MAETRSERLSSALATLVVLLAAFGLALVLAGCPSSTNDNNVVSVTSVAVVPAPDHGAVFDGEEGVLNYLFTVVGDGVFPLDLQGTVDALGEAFPFSFTVYRPTAATYTLVVRVRGIYSEPFELIVTSSSLVASVSVTADPLDPGVAVAGITRTVNYQITITSVP